MWVRDGLDLLDDARAVVLRTAFRTRLGHVLRNRDRRSSLRASFAIVVAFLLAWTAPAFALAVSPLVLGVPHVAASIRYLVLRQALSRSARWLVVLPAAVLLALRVYEQYGGAVRLAARLEVTCGLVWALAAAFHGARTAGRIRRAWFALPVFVTLAAVGLRYPTAMRLAFVHAHNLGAVALWLLLFRRRRVAAPVLLLAAALVLLASGVATPLSTRGFGVDLEMVGRWLAPGAAASVAVPLVLLHVFTDSVHYAFWLGVIPEETLGGQGTLTFRMTWRGLRRDFGDAGLALVLVLTLGVVLFATFGAARARDAYFAIAGFHGYLEGAALAWVLCASVRRA